jgi:GNAT superfamily N-acetyltransferase
LFSKQTLFLLTNLVHTMELVIEPYQDWMKEQVSGLFSMQYQVDKNDFAKLIDNFYDHPYQKDKCIRIVARDGKKIVGFQSFFHWPYSYKNKNYNSYQSGNSLVHPDYRGKGIFQKLLNFIDDKKDELSIDFLMGFPVEESKNSFIRNKWNNILDLQWYLKIVNPFSFLFPVDKEKIQNCLNNSFQHHQDPDLITLSNKDEFAEWRKMYSQNQHYFYHQYIEAGTKNTICFQLKLVNRKKIINELVIGNIQSDSNDPLLVENGIKDLIKRVKKTGCVTVMSIAINNNCKSGIKKNVKKIGFIKTNKSIYFIIKPFKEQNKELLNPELWSLYRSDIDTW